MSPVKHTCIVGQIAGDWVNLLDWPHRLQEFEKETAYFDSTTRAVPHPGFAKRFAYCLECGKKIDWPEDED